MPIKIRRFKPEDIGAIERLNERLREGGSTDLVYPEDPKRSFWDGDCGPVSTRLWVAASENEIHGGVWLKEHDFWAAGQKLRAGWVKYPVAESIVNRNYGGVPAAMIFSLVRHQPRLMIAGMGGHDQPIARLLTGMGWRGDTVPLYFYIVRPKKVLRELSYLRSTGFKRLLCDCLAFSGFGWIGAKMVTAWRRSSISCPSVPYLWEHVDDFGSWVERIWKGVKNSYQLTAMRNREMLKILYALKSDSLKRIRVQSKNDDIGWACVTRQYGSSLSGSNYGNAKVGMIVDCFGLPENARSILAAAKESLIQSEVDIIVTNMIHPKWCRALESLGFLKGPKNYAFYRAPAMIKAIQLDADDLAGIHLTRADSHFPEAYSDLADTESLSTRK